MVPDTVDISQGRYGWQSVLSEVSNALASIDVRNTHSCFCCASLASLQFALGALVDEPMWSTMAHVAVPEDECGIRLDRFEHVLALPGLGHICLLHVSDCYAVEVPASIPVTSSDVGGK